MDLWQVEEGGGVGVADRPSLGFGEGELQEGFKNFALVLPGGVGAEKYAFGAMGLDHSQYLRVGHPEERVRKIEIYARSDERSLGFVPHAESTEMRGDDLELREPALQRGDIRWRRTVRRLEYALASGVEVGDEAKFRHRRPCIVHFGVVEAEKLVFGMELYACKAGFGDTGDFGGLVLDLRMERGEREYAAFRAGGRVVGPEAVGATDAVGLCRDRQVQRGEDSACRVLRDAAANRSVEGRGVAEARGERRSNLQRQRVGVEVDVRVHNGKVGMAHIFVTHMRRGM